MPHPYLPKRKSGTENRFPTPTAQGVWEEREQTHLQQLAESIEIPPTASKIYSIPDPWARALFFDRALFDDNHTMHQTVVDEWRGVLALIGLKERRKFQDLKTLRVDLSAAAKVPESFANVLKLLMPVHGDFIAPDSTWDNFDLLRWQMQGFGRPRAFALTSPMTLLCTASDYTGLLPEGEIPWYNGAILTDPKEHLSKRERTALAEWLQVIIQKVTAYPTNTTKRGNLLRQLQQFATSLATITAALNEADVLAEKGKSLGFQGVFRILDLPCKEATGVLSDVEIVGKPGAPRNVLIDPDLEENLNEKAREIVIYRDVTLATSKRYTDAGTASGVAGEIDDPDSGKDGKEPRKIQIHWCTPDFFFSDTLVYEAADTNAFPGCRPVQATGEARKRSIALPLNPETLELFDPETIAKNFSVDWQSDGSAVCRLRLLLRSSSGEERTCPIKKVYREVNMVRIEHLPLICTWPNFRLKAGWNSHYLFQMWYGSAKEELRVEPWSPAEPKPVSEPRRLNLDGRRFQICRTDHHPEVLICRSPYYNQQKQREWEALGLLVLQLPDVLDPSEQTPPTLGVDFGSTGSNVFVRMAGGEAEPVVFKNRLRQITDFDLGNFRDFNRELFIPAGDWSAKNVLSVFHDFGDPTDGENARLVVRDGHILYAEDPGKFISPTGDRNRVKSNLKWGGSRERLVSKDFLRQLCLQAAAEMAVKGAREVKLRYSWPTAFSKEDRHLFDANWGSVPGDIAKKTGVKFTINPDADNSEAVAATRYFTKHPGDADPTGYAITFDIGGGTSDLAIWNRLELYSHNSVLFAGRDVFLAPLRRRPELLADIDSRVPLERLQRAQRDSAFDAHLDAIVACWGDRLIEALPIHSSKPSVHGFLQLLELGLCGLGFFAGLMVRRLIDKNALQKEDGKNLSIFGGGNGSKMFQWCALGQFSDRAGIHDRFAAAFKAGADWQDLGIHIQLSNEFKSEVAYGLVSEPLDLEIRSGFSEPLAGEQFRIQAADKSWTDQAWTESPGWPVIRDRAVAVDRKLPQFRRFLKSLGREVSAAELDKICGAVDLRFMHQAAEINAALKLDRSLKGENLLRNEPIFIFALKSYLGMETEAWMNHA
jgi:hypothetical protein